MTAAGDPGRPVDVDPPSRGRTETTAGACLIGLVVVAALFFRRHPGPVFLDRWGFSLIPPAVHDTLYKRTTELGSVTFLVAGSILAALVVVGRDRLRAAACLVGPGLSVVLVEWLLKPVIARRYAEVLTFPSGTTTVVASVATAWALAVPRRVRPVAVVVGAILIGLECMAVIALQWHFPTDALGGVAVGIGVVLLIDGLLHMGMGARVAGRHPPAGAGDPAASPF